jgi:polar amino acid transport system permease protein
VVLKYDFDFEFVLRSLPILLDGLGTTLQLALITIILSMILAVPVAVARMAETHLVRWLAQGYIELFRCTPMLVQLFWIYFALPAFTGVTIPGYTSAIIALTANLTAFMAEAYRSGFQSVPVEQIEAGQMLRLSRWLQLRHIIIPQAIRQQIPVILSLNISMFKDTALVSTIAVADLMFRSNTVAVESFKALEVFTTAAFLYFAIAFPVSLLTSYIERRGQQSASRRAKPKAPAGVATPIGAS